MNDKSMFLVCTLTLRDVIDLIATDSYLIVSQLSGYCCSLQLPCLALLVFIGNCCSFYLQMIESKFGALFNHSMLLLKKKWLFGIIDDFITKQLPHNVTWGLSLLYAMEHKGDRALTSTQGEGNSLTFLNYSFY